MKGKTTTFITNIFVKQGSPTNDVKILQLSFGDFQCHVLNWKNLNSGLQKTNPATRVVVGRRISGL